MFLTTLHRLPAAALGHSGLLNAWPPARPWPCRAEWAQNLLEQMGPRFAGPIAIVRNWTYCLFYVMAELWGSVVVSVLFWGFANQITTVDEAKQFYPLFGLGANVALIFSGRAVKIFSQVRARAGDAGRVGTAAQHACVAAWLVLLTAHPFVHPRRSALACPPAWTAGACPCAA